MARNGTYYVGRVLKLGILDQSMLIRGVLRPTSIKIRGNAWTIIDSQEYKKGDDHFIYGRLSKYSPEGEVVFRILCHFFIISKKEMTYDQTHFRHRRRHQGTA
jgi:hypothetical protein